MSVYISVELQRRVRERFSNYCAYCRTAEALTATTFEFEHIIPTSAGGDTAFENLCLACPMCNRHKSDHLLASDPVTQTEVPLFDPQKQVWRDHFSWSDDGTQVVGLTPTGRATVAAFKMNRPQMIRVRRMWVAMNEHPVDMD
jgi:hypothetical protein